MRSSPDRGDYLAGVPADEVQLAGPSRTAALELLRLENHGRLIHTQRALPAVTLAWYALQDDEAVLVPVAEGSPLWQADEGVVAFEVDRIEGPRDAPSGWIVLVMGYAELVTEPARLERLGRRDALGPRPAGGGEAMLRIPTEVVTGSWLGGLHL